MIKILTRNCCLVFFIPVISFLFSSCGGSVESQSGPQSQSSFDITLNLPDGDQLRAFQRTGSQTGDRLAAPSYVTGATLTLTSVDGSEGGPYTFDIPLDTGDVSGSVPEGEYKISAVVTTSIDLTFSGSITTTLVSGASNDIVIDLAVNAPPEIVSVTVNNSGPWIGDTVTATCVATDADNESITYEWSGVASGSGDSISYTIPAEGSYTFTCTAKDGRGGVATDSVTVSVIKIINLVFADANLTACFNDYANIKGWSYVSEVKTLDCYNRGIVSLTGIENLIALQVLLLETNQISDLTPLQNLTTLTRLDLKNNQITSVTPLQNLTALPWLAVDGNQIVDVTPLQNLTALKELWLDKNQIVDVTPLQNLTALRGLGLKWNQIVSVTSLQGLTALTGLGLDFNQIVDVTPLSNLTGLAGLSLDGNQIVSVTPLSALTALTGLSIDSNLIADVTPLQGLTALNRLSLGSNQIVDVTPLQSLTSLNWLNLSMNLIGGQGVGNVHLLSPALGATIYLGNNLGMSCAELGQLIANPNGYAVDVPEKPGLTCANP